VHLNDGDNEVIYCFIDTSIKILERVFEVGGFRISEFSEIIEVY
jgi:hypothetical protein